MSPLPANLKDTPLYRNIRNSILSIQSRHKPINVSDSDIKRLEILLKEDIEYFYTVKNP